jgi:hypothetical protein
MIQTIFGSPVVVLESNDVETLFPKEIYDEIVDHLMGPESKFVMHPYTRGGKVCTTDLNFTMNNDKINRLDTLLNFLKHLGLQYSHLFSDNPVNNLKFHNMWINLSFQGCEIKNHCDKYEDTTDKSLIVLFYPKAPKGGANLVFIHNSKYGEWSSDRSEDDLVRINIENGNIIIIDNSILHAVDKHNLNEPRMCVATEFKLET